VSAKVDEKSLVDALRAGDEATFVQLVDRNESWMLRTALSFGSTRAVAEEIVQETWVSFLRGIDRFEGRSALRTWLFAILANAARKRAMSETRTIPWSSLDREPGGDDGIADQFFDPGHPRWANCWTSTVPDWSHAPEHELMASEAWRVVEETLATLPSSQRLVFTLRDVEDWSSGDVCNALDISDSNERVLLHRARLRVRATLERYYATERDAC
jgi:RNA polymerase sigma-70 factor, ECF subfamily